MKKALIAIITLGLMAMAGCTVNNRQTDINFEAGHDMKVDASGAKHSTDTAQTADGDFSGLIEAVKAWADKNIAGIVDKLDVGDEIVIPDGVPDPPEGPAAVNPGQGEFEEVE